MIACNNKFNFTKKKCIGNIMNQRNQYNDMIEEAVFPNGKKHSHQYRIPVNTLKSFMKFLVALEKELIMAKDFESIFQTISSIKLKGIGDLTKYDVALRFGMQKDIYPEKIYLHAGTKKGAKALGLLRKHTRKQFLTMDEIPDWLRIIQPYQIEDFLCQYKHSPTKKSLKIYIEKYCK